MPTIQLPEFPRETEFEEFVSAYLQCGGYFVERQIHEQETRDVLELDVVLTAHTASDVGVRIAEVKSGEWGCSDLFKLAGWMRYLGVDEAILASLGAMKDADVLETVASRLNIGLATIETHEDAEEALRAFVGVKVDSLDVAMWRYAYWLERCLGQRLNDLRKSGGLVAPQRVYEVHKRLQTNLFAYDMLSRTNSLYDIFRTQPHLAARWASELLGADFDGDYAKLPKPIFEQVYYGGSAIPHDLDLVTWTEYRIRLSILKNLVDYELLRRKSGDAAFNSVVYRIGGQDVRLADMLPASCRDAVKVLSEQPFFHRYAVLWQWFLWVGGGFLLQDHLQQEYEWLGRKSGMPATEVPRALEAFDVLFPTPNGWFKDLAPYNRITVLTMMPVCYHGVGANLRRFLYSSEHTFEGIALEGRHTRSQLVRWSNNVIARLASCRT